MITIDGSLGEGGGQILRSALALSIVTQKPFRIHRIRAGRAKPGLLRQHLTAVQAAAAVGAAAVRGAVMGSQELIFEPTAIVPGDFHFAIGTAGSTTLVLQTILPPLLRASAPSTITLEGGTHNPFAPPIVFLQKAFLPVLASMGAKVDVQLQRPGFYPAGGGRCTVTIHPAPRLLPIDLTRRGEIIGRKATAIIADLSRAIAQRELNVIRRAMNWPAECFAIDEFPGSCGPGNLVAIEIASEHLTEVFTGFGQRGVRAEAVADDALEQLKAYLVSGAPVGPYLADQLLLPLALAGAGSLVTMPLSRHATTNIEIIRTFLDIQIQTQQLDDHQSLIQVR